MASNLFNMLAALASDSGALSSFKDDPEGVMKDYSLESGQVNQVMAGLRGESSAFCDVILAEVSAHIDVSEGLEGPEKPVC